MINKINKIFILTIIFFSFSFFVTGCGSSKSTLQTTSSGISNDKSANSPEQTAPVATLSSLESWVGNYTFSEFVPPDENMFYSVSLYKENNNYYANISIDGFQTLIRLKAKVNGDANSINLVFDKYLPDNMYNSYNEGDILIAFKKTDAGIGTYWGKMTPIDEKNKEDGIYFERQESSEGYVGHWYTSVPYTGGNSTTIEIKEMSDSSVSFHLYFCRTYYYDATNIKLENNIAKFVDNGDYKTSGTIEFGNNSIVVNIEETELPILEAGKTVFNYKVSEFEAVSTTPSNGDTGVILDKGIEVDFGREIFNTTNSVVAILSKPNVSMESSDGAIILDGEIKGNKLILTPSFELMKTMNLKIEAGQKYELGIDGGVLRDEKGNINSEINLEFTTKQ